MSQGPAVIVLAAGQGSRYRQLAGAEQDKLLAACAGRDAEVRPVIEHVLRNLPGRITRRLLVTTPDRPEVARLAVAYGCQVLLLDSTGMGHSISAAVAACADADGWLILPGDMPFILPSSIERVLLGMGKGLISVPLRGAEYGHPVGFGADYGAALLGLSGDRGAKRLFASAKVLEVPLEDPGVLWDVDVPQALLFQG